MSDSSEHPAPPQKGWWLNLGLDEVLQKRLKLTPERIDAAVETSRDLGKSIAMSWHNLDEKVGKVLSHVKVVKASHQDHLTDTAVVLAGGLGYTLAGVEGLAGIAKLIHGCRQGDRAEQLSGFLDLTAGAAIWATLAGAGTLPWVLGPIAAGLGVARGAVHAVKAYQAADPSKEVEGFLESARSATLMCSLMSGYSAVAATAGAIIGPVAVAVQSARGYVRVKEGLKQADKSQQMSGLADIGTAVGLTLSFVGLPLPGIAVMVAAQGANLLHKVVPCARRMIDKGLDVAKVPLSLAVAAVEKTIDPAFNKIRKWIDEHSPWQHGETSPKKGKAAAAS